jgi:hypothetical protein
MNDADSKSTRLATNLCAIHGRGHISTGRSGKVLSLPCPKCLEVYGRRELTSRHLAVLLDKAGKKPKSVSAYCMKHNATHRYSLEDLMSFPPMSVRVPGYVTTTTFKETPTETHHPLLRHESGVDIPYPPGKLVPLTELPADHVALRYLASRGYNIAPLVKQFGCAWCTDEEPRTKENGLHYRQWEGGFNNTPQGRIIFQALVNHVPVGWQGRLLDTWQDNQYFIYHPYTGEWVAVGSKENGELVYYPAYSSQRRPLSKYANALGMLSGSVLFGQDNYVDSNSNIEHRHRVLVLTEGPLDAARFPLNGLAYTRAHISPAQARIAASLAHTVVLASDNDDAAAQARTRNMEILYQNANQVIHISPEPFKDFGEAGQAFSTQTLLRALQTK